MKIPQMTNGPDSLQAIARVDDKGSVPPHHATSARFSKPLSGSGGVEYEPAVEFAAWIERLHALRETREELIAEVRQRLSDPQAYLSRSAAEQVAELILGD